MLYLFGVYSIEDFSVDKNDKEKSITRILSNHCCFIDILYYLYKYFHYYKGTLASLSLDLINLKEKSFSIMLFLLLKLFG